ncbi:putative oxidoreductase YrbE [Tubulanus polymorphus]|uniref:putative oxidoreductase YrbE n=1 Tax=Tubulanus polymorphus TaxID=672921 RepID=UPI003DA369B1
MELLNGLPGANLRKKFGVAIFGVGRSGQIHLNNLSASHRAQVLYLVDRNTNLADDLVEQYNLEGDTTAIKDTDADEVFLDERVQCVFVCTPTYTHYEIVQKSLDHGKHVFCEKPISQNIEQTKQCYDDAEKAGKILFCSLNRRYDPSLQQLFNKREEYGQIFTVKSCSRDHPLPSLEYLKISGGIFHDCAVHDIDFICWILDSWPETVYVQGHTFSREIAATNDLDTCFIIMKYPTNTSCVIELSRFASYGYHQTLEIFAENGMFISENQRPFEISVSNKQGMSYEPIKYSFPQRYKDSYEAALKNFFDVIQGKETLKITKDSIVRVHKIIEACERGLSTGQVVKIDYEH